MLLLLLGCKDDPERKPVTLDPGTHMPDTDSDPAPCCTAYGGGSLTFTVGTASVSVDGVKAKELTHSDSWVCPEGGGGQLVATDTWIAVDVCTEDAEALFGTKPCGTDAARLELSLYYSHDALPLDSTVALGDASRRGLQVQLRDPTDSGLRPGDATYTGTEDVAVSLEAAVTTGSLLFHAPPWSCESGTVPDTVPLELSWELDPDTAVDLYPYADAP